MKYLLQNYTVSYLKSLGVDLKKIVIIVSSTSQTWTLDDSSDTSVGAKATKPGNKGSYTLHPGILSYYETCKLLMQDGWTIKYDPEAKVPYAYRGDQWIGYDDVKSVSEKGLREGLSYHFYLFEPIFNLRPSK
ncbi:acidic mammalian chitinase-like isoform X2 [Centruroides sculpturatus]|uniref:acidic mammalian chitinase-like isoform X2 n=1 Tax=Centruroides sculpturatus TaxID=218467 RepID=UPI000C6E53F7|nr:acidic mammalian chitinase-like isoform X2 [Centruroides sculpturatus]